MANPYRSLFLLDPAVVYLNHGSFGACPRPVFELYQRWQRELERQPVEFLGRCADQHLATARQALARFVNVPADDLVFFTNPTTALNMVIHNLARPSGLEQGAARPFRLQPGDEVLATDHEYGALERTWRHVCRQTGARYVRHPIPLPVPGKGEPGAEGPGADLPGRQRLVEDFWQDVTPHTRIIFISQITSPTALRFPVEDICRRARAAGILTVVDGAHAPGQIPLDLAVTGADIYAGSCNKWLCAPKGTAFLYAREEMQGWLEPLVVSWGWESEQPGPSPLVDWHQWQGTRDISAFLTVPAAIAFQEEHGWPAVRADCHDLAAETRDRINALTGLPPVCPDSSEWFVQMFTARLPAVDLDLLKRRLYDEYRVEVPLVCWNDQQLIRVSIQAYNDRHDADVLLQALATLLPELAQ